MHAFWRRCECLRGHLSTVCLLNDTRLSFVTMQPTATFARLRAPARHLRAVCGGITKASPAHAAWLDDRRLQLVDEADEDLIHRVVHGANRDPRRNGQGGGGAFNYQCAEL